MGLTVYQSMDSPNSRRVRIYLAERGITCSMIDVDLSQLEQFSPAYSMINPQRVVPTLVLDDGTAIGEVPAVIRYLDEAISERPINGATPKEKALIQMWERRAELEGFAAVMETVRNAAKGLSGRAIAGPHGYDQIPALVDRGRLRVRDFYDDLEARLALNPHVAGETFSVADITAVVTIDFAAKALSLGIPEGNAATRRWHAALSARPSFSA